MEAVELKWLTQKPSREPRAFACVVYINLQCTHTPRAIRLLHGSITDFLNGGATRLLASASAVRLQGIILVACVLLHTHVGGSERPVPIAFAGDG